MSVAYWAIAVVVFLVIEIATTALVSIWFVGGAVAGLIVSALGGALWVQITAFCVVSVVLIFALRPLAGKYFTPKAKFGTDRLMGADAVVSEDIDNLAGRGAVRADGKEWSARSCGGEIIERGSIVKILSVEGVKLIVEKKGE